MSFSERNLSEGELRIDHDLRNENLAESVDKPKVGSDNETDERKTPEDQRSQKNEEGKGR